MQVKWRCDICGKDIEVVALRLFLVDTTKAPKNTRAPNNYQRRADIGECCRGRVEKSIRWNKRLKRELNGRGQRPSLRAVDEAEPAGKIAQAGG